MNLKNIIIINDSAHITGGAGKVAFLSAEGLVKKGLHVILFTAVAPIDPKLLDMGVEVICLEQYDILSDPNRLRAIQQGLWNIQAKSKLESILEKYSPENTIVHFHAWIKALSPSLLATTAKYKYKVVITLHDYFLFCPNGGLFNYQTKQICDLKAASLKCLLNNCDARSYPQKIWRYLRHIVQSISFCKNENISIILISALNRQLAEPYLAHKVKYWFDLKNPIELNKADIVDISKNNIYLFIGRLSAEKGVDLFCRAITELGLKGCVLGDGYLKEKLENEYPNIDFTGWVSGKQKEEWIKKGKALIFTSLWYEGAPLTIIEMKSYGIPCIVPDRCAASEEIIDGKTGYIFQSGSLESLKECISKYEHTDVLEFQKDILKNFDSQVYSLDSHTKSLVSIYNTVLYNIKDNI